MCSPCPKLRIAVIFVKTDFCPQRDSNLGPLAQQARYPFKNCIDHCDLSSLSARIASIVMEALSPIGLTDNKIERGKFRNTRLYCRIRTMALGHADRGLRHGKFVAPAFPGGQGLPRQDILDIVWRSLCVRRGGWWHVRRQNSRHYLGDHHLHAIKQVTKYK